MKGLILSGGKGTRLRPLTHTSAKQLIPIANKPVLFYAIEAMVEAGIRDIGIIVGETKNEIEEAVGDGSSWGAKIKYILQEEPRGLAHAVLVAKEYLDGEPFVMFLGDNLIKGGIVDFVQEFRKEKPNALILLTPVKNPSEFGVAELVDGRVVRLEEKPKEPRSNLALVGVYIFDKNIMKAANSVKPSWRDELEITDAIQHLIDSGLQVKPHIVKGWWKDTGKLEDILEANRIVLEGIEPEILGKVDEKSKLFGRVRIEKGAEIINSNIRGPAVIGENTKIIDSYIGPFTSVYYNVSITKSEIEHSIILENSTIMEIGSRLEDSLIGKGVTVYKAHTKPKAYKLMLGDNSLVGII